MRKLRILLVEVVGLGVLIAWLMWKYPELVDNIIPWVALAVLWHCTWEFIFDTRVAQRVGASLHRMVRPMIAWPLVFVIGGGISTLYWWGINKSMLRLATIAAERLKKPTSGAPSNPSTFLGVHKPDETFAIPPKSSAIVSYGPVTPERAAELERIAKDEEKVDSEAKQHWETDPEKLTLHDLYRLDFSSNGTTSKRYGKTTFRNGKTGVVTPFEYAVIWQLEAGTKILLFYIPYSTETSHMCVSLSDNYKFPLSDFFESRTEAQKTPGDSEQVSSQNLTLSNRIFIYHEIQLSPEQIIEARNAWKKQGIHIIFRSNDYLANKNLEARVKQLEKQRSD